MRDFKVSRETDDEGRDDVSVSCVTRGDFCLSFCLQTVALVTFNGSSVNQKCRPLFDGELCFQVKDHAIDCVCVCVRGSTNT